ncbi:MAG TPA: nucleotidyltransferase domain-containing protein [Candidatus Saccharimonadales bacterium]|nr:nucleotidyltransferase domain-containing protein [Candidatus Saccharimonadales bacterium]
MTNNLSAAAITNHLQALCTSEGVECIFGVESGSRSWGFASPDSDYDVRFIYLRPQADYLRITRPRDVIEFCEPVNNLDMVGWDAPKALQLLGKSNPSIIEWLHTPLVYSKHDQALVILQEAAKACFSAKALAMHYTLLGEGHVAKYILRKEMIAPKKYFYALRSILSAQFVIHNNQPAPIVFEELLSVSHIPSDIRTIIDDLLAAKKVAGEKEQIVPLAQLNTYIIDKLEELLPAARKLPQTSTITSEPVIEEAFQKLLQLAD